MEGGIGNDYAYGETGADILFGGDGADTLEGANDDDVLAGGQSDDALHGGGGGDVYVVNRNEGKDTIRDDGGANGGDDTLIFGYGIDINDLSFDLTDGNELYVGIGEEGEITPATQALNRVRILDWQNTDDRVETFVFANGLVMDVRNVSEASGTGTNLDFHRQRRPLVDRLGQRRKGHSRRRRRKRRRDRRGRQRQPQGRLW